MITKHYHRCVSFLSGRKSSKLSESQSQLSIPEPAVNEEMTQYTELHAS